MNRRRWLRLTAGVLAAGGAGPAGAQASRIDAMRFSTLQAGGRLPDELRPWGFGNRAPETRYTLVADEGEVVLRADAERSASGIVREMRVDARTHPTLSWRWKAMSVVEKGDLRTKEGDDFVARVYVTFDVDPATLPAGERMKLSLARMLYGERVPAAALCYVWDGKAPRDTFLPNAYTPRVAMIVAESGSARTGKWVRVERNIATDYRRAFGTAPPQVSGVIVSTDTDNTGETAVAFYGDISFGPP